MHYKQLTAAAYERNVEHFEKKFAECFERVGTTHTDVFLSELTGNAVLDLGSGPGVIASYFFDQGLDVTCADISPEMVKRCNEKGLSAVVMDLEHLGFADNSFDGVWSLASLLHVPRTYVPQAVAEIKRVVKPGGTIGIGVKEGTDEGYESMRDTFRWFTYFSNEEVIALFSDCITRYTLRKEMGKFAFLNYVFQRKSN